MNREILSPALCPMFISKTIKPGDIVISSPKGIETITDEELYKSFEIRIVERSISPSMK